MNIFARFSVLALALVGFTASTVVSHAKKGGAHAGSLGPAVACVNVCGPHNEGGCNLR